MSFICHIHNYTEYNEEWNVFSAFNPSKCTHLEQWAADCAAPGSSRGLPPGAGIQTHNLGLPRVSSPTLYPLGHDCNDGSSVAMGSGSPSSVVSGFGSAQWGDGGLGSGLGIDTFQQC